MVSLIDALHVQIFCYVMIGHHVKKITKKAHKKTPNSARKWVSFQIWTSPDFFQKLRLCNLEANCDWSRPYNAALSLVESLRVLKYFHCEMVKWLEMAAIEKIVEGDGVITVYFSSPYEVEVDNIREGFWRIFREKVLTVLFLFFSVSKKSK